MRDASGLQKRSCSVPPRGNGHGVDLTHIWGEGRGLQAVACLQTEHVAVQRSASAAGPSLVVIQVPEHELQLRFCESANAVLRQCASLFVRLEGFGQPR